MLAIRGNPQSAWLLEGTTSVATSGTLNQYLNGEENISYFSITECIDLVELKTKMAGSTMRATLSVSEVEASSWPILDALSRGSIQLASQAQVLQQPLYLYYCFKMYVMTWETRTMYIAVKKYLYRYKTFVKHCLMRSLRTKLAASRTRRWNLINWSMSKSEKWFSVVGNSERRWWNALVKRIISFNSHFTNHFECFDKLGMCPWFDKTKSTIEKLQFWSTLRSETRTTNFSGDLI